jgi:hypothetical protein
MVSKHMHESVTRARRFPIITRHPVLKVGIVSLAFAILLSGCSGQDDVAHIDIDAELDVESIASETTEFQREMLEDGVVTQAEYERALLAQRDCVIAAGAEPGELYEIGNNQFTFDYDISAATNDELDKIQVKADACTPKFFSDVGKVWAYQQLLTPAEREAQRPLVIACLVSVGIEVDEDADLTEIARSVIATGEPDRVAPCVEEYPGYFAVPPSSGEHGHSH